MVTTLVRVIAGRQLAIATGDFLEVGIGLEFERAQCPGLFIDIGKALPEVIDYFFHICLGGIIVVIPIKVIRIYVLA